MPERRIDHVIEAMLRHRQAWFNTVEATQQVGRIVGYNSDVTVVPAFKDVRLPAARFQPRCGDARLLLPKIAAKHEKAGCFVFLANHLIILHDGTAAIRAKQAEVPDVALAEMAET